MMDFSELFSQIGTYHDDADEDSEELKEVSELKSEILKISQQSSILDRNRRELRDELEEMCFTNRDLSIQTQILKDKKKMRDKFTQAVEGNINLQRALIDLLKSMNFEAMDKYHQRQQEYHEQFRLKVHNESCEKIKENLETLNEQANSLDYVKSLKEKIEKGKEMHRKLAELEECLKSQEQGELNCHRKRKDEMNLEVIKLATGYFNVQQFLKELPTIDADIASAEEAILEQEKSIKLIEEENKQLQEMCKEEEDRKNDLLDYTPLSHIVFKIPKNPAVRKRKLSVSEPANERGVKHFLVDLKQKPKAIQTESECAKAVTFEMPQCEKQEIEAEVISSDSNEAQHTIPKEGHEGRLPLSSKITDNSSKKVDDDSKQQVELVLEQSKKDLPKIEIIENIIIKPPEPQYATVDIWDISGDSEVLHDRLERSISLDHSYSQGSNPDNKNDKTIIWPSSEDPENSEGGTEERKTCRERFEKFENIAHSPDKIIEILDESVNDELKDKSEDENMLITEKLVETVEIEAVTKTVEKQPEKRDIDKSKKLSGKFKAKGSKKKKDFSFDIFDDDFFNEPKPSKRKRPSDSCKDTDGRAEGEEPDVFDNMEPTTSKKSKDSNKCEGDFDDFFTEMYNPAAGSDEESNNLLIDFEELGNDSEEIPGESGFHLSSPSTSPSGSQGSVDNNENSN